MAWSDTHPDLFREADAAKEAAKATFLRLLGNPRRVPEDQVIPLVDAIVTAQWQALLRHIGPVSTDGSIVIDVATTSDGVPQLDLRAATMWEVRTSPPIGGLGAPSANLLTNPGGEDGSPALRAVPTGWTRGIQNAGLWRYDTAGTYVGSDNMDMNLVTAPSDRGDWFFFGGQPVGGTDANPISTLSQTVDVSAYGTDIDTGAGLCTASGWLGGWQTDPDYCEIDLTFLDSTNRTITRLAPAIPTVSAADRGNVSSLLFRSGMRGIPKNTRKIIFTLTFVAGHGPDLNNGYADNLSLTVQVAGSFLDRPKGTFVWVMDSGTGLYTSLWAKVGDTVADWIQFWPATEPPMRTMMISAAGILSAASGLNILAAGNALKGISTTGLVDGRDVVCVTAANDLVLLENQTVSADAAPLHLGRGGDDIQLVKDAEARFRFRGTWFQYIGGTTT